MKLAHVRTMPMPPEGGVVMCVRCGSHAALIGHPPSEGQLVRAFRRDHAGCSLDLPPADVRVAS